MKLLSVSKEQVFAWQERGVLNCLEEAKSPLYKRSEVLALLEHKGVDTKKLNFCKAEQDYAVLELFAGAGGLALGLEAAGLRCAALNELDKWACQTLRKNRPQWNVLEGDVRDMDFRAYNRKIDLLTGGFPCQAFSYAGKKLGLEDTRGTLFYEFARAVQEVQPALCIGENVRGLLSHEKGRTLEIMLAVLDDLGYRVMPVRVLKAIHYRVPQKRERLILVGVRKDIDLDFIYPKAHSRIFTLEDALKKGDLFSSDVPESGGARYPEYKKKVLDMVPPRGCWRDLPLEVQKEYMGGSFYLGGGKTGMARRIAWDEPSLTLTCSPAQKQTERCHPEETRPFTVREYARIQTFPDDWEFAGALAQQYKQIGNAVPVNLAKELGYAVIRFLNAYYKESKPRVRVVKAV